MDDENNRWIETRLAASFEHLDLPAAPVHARYQATTPRWRRKRMSFLAGLPAVLTTKAAAAAAIALTAAGGAVATKAVVTGSPNPLNWGSTVTQQVQSCQAALTTDHHGIGSCVSGTASQHGQQERQSPAPAAPSHPTGAPSTTPAHPTGPPAGTVTGPPATTPAHPTGPPSGTVTGPPATTPAHPTGPPSGTETGPPATTPAHPTGAPTATGSASQPTQQSTRPASL
jgi:hypothetical protein